MVRALYFHLYDDPFSGSVVSLSPHFFTPGLEYGQLGRTLTPIFAHQKIWRDGETRNREIFDFRYTEIAPGPQSFMVILMIFYTSIHVIAFLTLGEPHNATSAA